jgi:ribonuclease Z
MLKGTEANRRRLQLKTTLLTIAAAVCSCALLNAQGSGLPKPIITVQLLGTGVPLLDPIAYVNSGRVTAGLLVTAGTERLLFDCGQGIVTRLLQSGGPAGNPNAAVDRVFISHLHSDHYADLPTLYAYGWLFRYNDPLQVWGPGPGPNGPFGMGSIMPLLRAVFDTDFYIRSALFTQLVFPVSGVQPIVTELKPGIVYQNNNVTVTAFLVDHMPVNPAYGFKVDFEGHSVVYSGDTKYNPSGALTKMATGADILLHEIWGYDPSVSQELFNYHTNPEDLARLLMIAQPRLTTLTHQGIPPGTTGEDLVSRIRIAGYSGPVQLGADLMTLDVFPNYVGVQNPPGPRLRSAEMEAEGRARVAPAPAGALPAEVRALMPAGKP